MKTYRSTLKDVGNVGVVNKNKLCDMARIAQLGRCIPNKNKRKSGETKPISPKKDSRLGDKFAKPNSCVLFLVLLFWHIRETHTEIFWAHEGLYYILW